MIDDDEEFLRELMQTFRDDAEERLKLLSQAIVELETSSSGEAAVAPLESLYREMHSLKGAASAVEQVQMESLCQQTESLLSALKQGELDVTPEIMDALSESIDCLQDTLHQDPTADNNAETLLQRLSTLAGETAAKKTGAKAKSGTTAESGTRARTSTAAKSGGGRKSKTPTKAKAETSAKAEPPAPQAAVPTTGTSEAQRAPSAQEDHQAPQNRDALTNTDNVRVSTAKLESIMLQAEEFISVKLTSAQRAASLHDLRSRLETWKQELHQARLSGDQDRIAEFLEWNTALVEGLMADLTMLAKAADDDHRTLGPMVDELLDETKRVLMLPVSSLLSSFPKMVRDLARNSGKAVDLVVTGAEIEIDKRIIENLKDPLVHILRNSVDHGIETPELRQERSKPPRGRISIAVTQLENNKIELCVSDDGGGIDTHRLRAVAERDGTRTRKQLDEMDDSEVTQLAFTSGISTSQQVSSVSGRGLGLAIVEQKVGQLGGTVSVETRAGEGTLFRINVPATLATARGILAQVGDWLFVIPVVSVDRAVRVLKDEIQTVENRETIQVDGRTLPLVYMQEVLDLPLKPQRDVSEYVQAIIAGSGDNRVAFAVDQVMQEQEVLVKSLGPQLLRVKNVAGVTVIGSGKVVPILNVVDLLEAAAARPGRGKKSTPQPVDSDAKKAVLIVEDSITSRMLLKNVLEAAGYYVKPTVDGVDALAALAEEEFDLVVSDIEMPRMDGVELTRKIRSDERFSRIPVVLVTALESPEDRERGLDAGANAYLTKSSFTQGTLLKTARSLL